MCAESRIRLSEEISTSDRVRAPKLATRLALLLLPLLVSPFLSAQEASREPLSAGFASSGSAPEASLSDAPSTVAAELRLRSEPVGLTDANDASTSVVVPRPTLPDAEQRNLDCENGDLRGKPCRVDWKRILAESFFFLSAQHGGNILMDSDTRYDLTHGSFWGDYAACVRNYRWSRWKDDDPFGVDYIGHPMMGALTNSIYEQNDPKQRALTLENSRRYWMGHLRATAYSAAYSAQWKNGPLSEASIGNTGIGYYVRKSDGLITNETGMQDFFITPIGGLAWNVGEDAMDRFFIAKVRKHTGNRLVLFFASFTTPGKSAANLSRFRAPYYRDRDAAAEASPSRQVR